MRIVKLFSITAACCAILCAQAQPDVRSLEVNGRIIHYEVRGGYAVVEGDIIIGTAADIEQAARADYAKSPRPSAVILNLQGARWPEATMPYVIDNDIPNQQRILDGIEHWNTRTQFKIVPRTNQTNYVRFVRDLSTEFACASSVGMVGGVQTILTTEVCNAGAVIHELGHAWGLRHEQVRADRNGNVTVLYQNMDKRFNYISNFDQLPSINRDVGYYDFGSIMHYGATGFTRNGLDSMETVPVGVPIGQLAGLSAGDIDGISRTYGFIPTQTTITSVPSGLTLTVDGASIVTPKAFDWAPGSTHTVTAPSVTGSLDPRYVFARWTDSPDISHTITASPGQTVFCAIYQAQHRFSYDVASGFGTVTASPAALDGYLPERLPVRVTATPAEGSSFVRWIGAFSLIGANSSVSSPDAVVQVAVPNTQFLGTFTTQPITTVKSIPPGRIVVVDGVSYLTPVNFAWAQGSTHTMSVTAAQTFGNNTVHYDFTGWENGATTIGRTVTAGSAPTFTASFSTKYLLTTLASGSGRVTVSPSSSDGYYDLGTEVKITAVPNAGFSLFTWLGDFAGATLEQTVIMDDQHYAVAVFGTPQLPSLPFSVLSAASFLGNPQFDATGFVVAPGEIATIFGSNLGPGALTTAQLDSNGRIATLLAGTRILFDGVPAPIIYTSANQVSVVVPFSVAGRTSTTVRTEFNGAVTAALGIGVGETAPGLFTTNASGKGQIAALNQDYGINSPSNPAESNSVVTLYATGGGQWTEAIADGAITGSNLVAPKAPVYTRVGKLPARILYVGTAPGLVNGALQINVELPKELIGGPAVPIQISVGNYTSAPGTTIAVK